MNIKSLIYDNLTTQQRLIASIEALARGDDSEHEKLVKTCPKKHYQQADYLYSGVLQGLMATAVSVELDLTKDALSMIACCMAESPAMEDKAGDFLQRISNCHTAWTETLEVMGLDPEAMAKLIKPLRHPIVDCILAAELPDPEGEAVKTRKEALEAFFGKLRNV